MTRKKQTGGHRRPPSGGRQWRGLGQVVRLVLAVAVWGMVALAALVAWYAYDLPDIAQLEEAAGKRGPTVTLQAADGSVLAHYGDLYGVAAQLHELPPHLPHAVLAVEDRRFYEHSGIDPRGVARALWDNVWAGGLRSGGSTISQQLAKNLFLSPERTLRRKVQEALLAYWLERRFGKDQILTIYLNRVYFGQGAYGVDAAARRYFGKPAKDVTVYESALLAGLLKAPSRYNPISSPQLAGNRARVVLESMVEAGWLTEQDADRARAGGFVVRGEGSGAQSRYVADWALEWTRDYVGYEGGDLVVATTIDPRLQLLAEAAVARNLAAARDRNAGQAALVAMRPDGAVVAMVGGRSYAESQFNRATQALRQPGSAFKLFVYLAAMEAGLRPGDQIEDRPVTVEGWTPRNAKREHRGTVSLREAVARSLNSVAVIVSEAVGRGNVAAAARRLGITSELHTDPALALGAYEVTLLELTAAYAVMANRGFGVWPYGVTEIRAGDGRVLYRRSGGGPGRVVEEPDVAAINDMLTAAIIWGTGKQARLDRQAAGKTGTSQDSRDAWFVGYTPDLVAGVWFGNDDNSPMDRIGGGSYPALTWKAFMEPAQRGIPRKPLLGVAAAPTD
ncbi:MAG: PBP1A family penicillin-binding protein [Alphaproteobacteria bacterium]|nr:PBP1A family penicillin-binding protein [Alphaproteobacteria bacterium]